MKIAIIGSGISGMAASALLHQLHEITLFEANDYIGGHTHTVDVVIGGERQSIDTGFIVFNEKTYSNFCTLLRQLDVASQPTEMSFSVRCDRTGLEYNGTSLNGVFAQRRNLWRPSFHRMLLDILRFNRIAEEQLNVVGPQVTVGEFLSEHGFSQQFAQYYLLPMGAAIWSCPVETFSSFPIRFIIDFYANHGLLQMRDRPIWRTITGGSREYVRKLTAPYIDRIRLSCPVHFVSRDEEGVSIQVASGMEQFDEVIFACHANTARRLLNDADATEQAILREFPYSRNSVVLHTDTTDSMKMGSTAHWLCARGSASVAIIGQSQAPHPHPRLCRSPVLLLRFPVSDSPAHQECHSCLYEGVVTHRRAKPFEHTFGYRLCWVYLDLDELDDVFRSRCLWSTSCPSLAWFRRGDHFGDPQHSLAESVRELVQTRTRQLPQGPIRLLTHLRYFGYVINPISVYYCFDASGDHVQTCVAEVTNTPWGERHCYVVPLTDDSGAAIVPPPSEKKMHVSPFQPMDMNYRWSVSKPGQTLNLRIENHDSTGRAFSAGMTLHRRPITGFQLGRFLVRYPLLTARIVTAIYWQAVKLWWKGAQFHPHPRYRSALANEPKADPNPTVSH